MRFRVSQSYEHLDDCGYVVVAVTVAAAVATKIATQEKEESFFLPPSSLLFHGSHAVKIAIVKAPS